VFRKRICCRLSLLQLDSPEHSKCSALPRIECSALPRIECSALPRFKCSAPCLSTAEPFSAGSNSRLPGTLIGPCRRIRLLSNPSTRLHPQRCLGCCLRHRTVRIASGTRLSLHIFSAGVMARFLLLHQVPASRPAQRLHPIDSSNCALIAGLPGGNFRDPWRIEQLVPCVSIF
jgi:hypothetical protein